MHLIKHSGLGFSTRRSQHIGLLGRISAWKKKEKICLPLSWLLDGDEDPTLLPLASHTALLVCNEMGSPSQLSPRQPGLGTGRGQSVCVCVSIWMWVCVNACLNWTFTTDGEFVRVDVRVWYFCKNGWLWCKAVTVRWKRTNALDIEK